MSGSARGWHTLAPARFDEMWSLHPPTLGRNTFDGRSVQTPRYFQAFGRAYSFSGQTAAPLPLARVPLAAEPLTKIAALVTAAGAGTAQVVPTPSHFLDHISPIFPPFFPVFARFHRLVEAVPTSPKPEPTAKKARPKRKD